MLGSLWFNSFSSGGGAAAYELISTTVLGSAQSSVTFDVSTLASTYKHLQLRATTRSTSSVGVGNFNMRFNSDTGANYFWHELAGGGSSVSSGAVTGTTSMAPGFTTGSAVSANAFCASIVDILDPFATTKNKTVRGSAGIAASSGTIVKLASGAWNSTAAVTSVTVIDGLSASSFIAGSRFSLYGIRGS